jgi:hypothetical protein
MLITTFILGFALIAGGVWQAARAVKPRFDDGFASLLILVGAALWAMALYLWCR